MSKSVLVIAIVFCVILNSCKEDNSQASLAIQEISVSPESLNLKVGETANLTATLTPAEAKVDAWSSSNSSIAAVNNGKVYAGAITGTATITAQAGDKKATCTVKVSEKEELKYPLCYEVKVNIGVHTITTYPSEKDPAPKDESFVEIAGTVIGTAVTGRIEKIISDPGYWADLAQNGYVPSFTASSEYKLRDENDYSKIIFETRNPLQVNVKKTKWDYITFYEGGKYVDKYTRIFDFLSTGKNEMQSISMNIVPYFPTRLSPPPPIIPQYALGLEIVTYTDQFGKKIVGNGHCLKWNYNTQQLEPGNDELYMGITGKKTETDPGEGVEAALIPRDMLNTYFMKAEGGSLTLSLKASSNKDNSGSKTQSIVLIKLEFRSIPNFLALASTTLTPPPLEDWDWAK